MYLSADVAERIKKIAITRNISLKEVLEKAGLNKNTLTNFKTSMPKADNLAKIADVLDCSVDYLLGREQKKEAPSPIDMDKRKARLIEIYDSMPDDESKDKLLQVVVSFERVNKYEIESQYIGGIAAKGGNKPIIKQIPHKDK